MTNLRSRRIPVLRELPSLLIVAASSCQQCGACDTGKTHRCAVIHSVARHTRLACHFCFSSFDTENPRTKLRNALAVTALAGFFSFFFFLFHNLLCFHRERALEATEIKSKPRGRAFVRRLEFSAQCCPCHGASQGCEMYSQPEAPGRLVAYFGKKQADAISISTTSSQYAYFFRRTEAP